MRALSLLAVLLLPWLAGCVRLTPLARSAYYNRTDDMRRLLDAGAPADAATAHGCRPIHSAAHAGSLQAIELLLERGVAVDSRCDDGETALMLAVWHGQPEAVRLLLARGADPFAKDNQGRDLEGYEEMGRRMYPSPGRDAIRALLRPALAGKTQARPETAASPAAPAQPPRLAPAFSRPEDASKFAVVVGVERYADLPKAAHASRDAAAVREHLKALGFPERNIVSLVDERATRGSLAKTVETWLANNAKGASAVFFYFSGHGAPDVKTGQPFLVPFDGDPRYLSDTAYPVERLYAKLAALGAGQVVVALDSCFSGAGGRSVLPAGARPLVPKVEEPAAGAAGVVSLTAARADEISGTLDERGHGAFTYFLLEGLGAQARAGGSATPEELHAYLAPRVADAARRENREQSPQLFGDASGRARGLLR